MFHLKNQKVIHYSKGICRGCSLSPLLGAFHLYVMDCAFASLMMKNKLHYVRYMDDFVILTKTRWQLRHAVKLLNQFFNHFGFVQHPDKTFIGRIAKGFDWMGAWITNDGIIRIAPRAIQNHLFKLTLLYEQTRKRPAAVLMLRVCQYQKRWHVLAQSVYDSIALILSGQRRNRRLAVAICCSQHAALIDDSPALQAHLPNQLDATVL